MGGPAGLSGRGEDGIDPAPDAAEAVLADQAAGEFAVRSALTRAIESLREVFRTIARSGPVTDEVLREVVADV
ncbi:hypothetical protein ACFXPY_42235 [Streptomyces sp. NPDC059153]|uniref:hypothetical protein n=1 Tax=Streptomyces sp. NPDC059153 TaxID=3346743 RepID=UPI0036930E0D